MSTRYVVRPKADRNLDDQAYYRWKQRSEISKAAEGQRYADGIEDSD